LVTHTEGGTEARTGCRIRYLDLTGEWRRLHQGTL